MDKITTRPQRVVVVVQRCDKNMSHPPSTEALPGESGSPSAVIMTAPRSTPLSGRNMVLGYTEAGS